MKRTQPILFQLQSFLSTFCLAHYLVFSIVLLFLFSSCKKEEEVTIEKAKDITIEEVKAVFNSRKVQHPNFRTNEPSSSMDIVWDLGIYKELEIGDVLFFPVKSNGQGEEKHYVSSGEGIKRFPVNYTSYGRAYKDETGEVVLEFIVPVPTENTPEFTGYLLLSNWGGEAKHMFNYEKGILVSQTGISQQQNTNEESNRSMAHCIITDHWNCVSVSSEHAPTYTTCTYVGSTIYCHEPPIGPSNS